MPRRQSAPPDYDRENAEILSRLNLMAEYSELGLTFASDAPRSSGKVECYARGRDEARPSAYVDTTTGHYGDSGGDHESLSFWDFAVKYSGGRFADWQAARKYYAEKAGVELTAKPSAAGSGGKKRGRPKQNPADVLDFEEWTAGNERLAAIWCLKHKPGPSVEAIRRAGGLVARYPCRTDSKTGERVPGKYKVIALPCYDPRKLAKLEPVAWVVWNLAGGELEIYRGRDIPPDRVKMKSVGSTAGTLMNRESLELLLQYQRDGIPPDCRAHKTAGPTDMLTLMAAIPPELRPQNLVLANASGEAGDVPDSVASLFSGYRVLVLHDRDTAGDIGAAKWLAALRGVAGEARSVRLPYPMRDKHGHDLRDYLLGVEVRS